MDAGYDSLEASLGYEILVRVAGNGLRCMLLRDGQRYGVLEYDTLGFPAPNDPEGIDRWKRDSRQDIFWGSRDEIAGYLTIESWWDLWGVVGRTFVEHAQDALAEDAVECTAIFGKVEVGDA